MKDSKFIELLNLYIDHQISPEEAALLEAEIQQKPERRRIYREYCQMQKACVILAENFRSDAPEGDKVIGTTTGPRRMAFITYAMGVAAAAACIALVVVNRPGVKQGTPVSSLAAVEELAVAKDQIASSPTESARPPLQPAFAVVKRDEAAAETVASTATDATLDWMHQVQVQRVSSEPLWFETPPTLQAQDLTLRSARPYEGNVETTAFIFAK